MSMKRGKKMSPWWGNDKPSATPQNGTLDPSLLPKLGQPKRAAARPINGGPGAPPNLGGPQPAAAPAATPSPVQPLEQTPKEPAPSAQPPADPKQGRVPLHVPYLDTPPNKPATLLKQFPQHREPRTRPKIAEADLYGVKSLLEVLKADSSGVFSPAVGTDIPPFLAAQEQVSKSFGSPWPEMAKHCVVPEHSLPSCYVVNSVVPQQQKLQNLTEETLFYIFYTMPRDAMQEAVAVELTNRNWRYHKDLKLWLTKDPLSEPVQQNQHAESGVYVFFDPSSWEKVKKEYVLYYPDIA